MLSIERGRLCKAVRSPLFCTLRASIPCGFGSQAVQSFIDIREPLSRALQHHPTDNLASKAKWKDSTHRVLSKMSTLSETLQLRGTLLRAYWLTRCDAVFAPRTLDACDFSGGSSPSYTLFGCNSRRFVNFGAELSRPLERAERVSMERKSLLLILYSVPMIAVQGTPAGVIWEQSAVLTILVV